MGNGLEMKFTEPLGGIQQAGAPKTAVKSITPIVLLAVIDYDCKRLDTSFYLTRS